MGIHIRSFERIRLLRPLRHATLPAFARFGRNGASERVQMLFPD
jgi:hypothetical protein